MFGGALFAFNVSFDEVVVTLFKDFERIAQMVTIPERATTRWRRWPRRCPTAPRASASSGPSHLRTRLADAGELSRQGLRAAGSGIPLDWRWPGVRYGPLSFWLTLVNDAAEGLR